MSRGKTAQSELAKLRAKKGLSQAEIANLISVLTGDEVGQAAVSYWELGKVDMRKVHPRRLRAYAKSLGITTTQLAEAIGVDELELFPEMSAPPLEEPRVSRSAALSAGAQGYRGPKPERTIPEALKEAAQLFGHLPMFDGLNTLRWQLHLSQIPYKHRPTTPEEWAEEFLEVKAKHDPPEVE